MFIVKTEISVIPYYLRSTVLTAERSRANEFATQELAQAALEKAKKFMKPATYKSMQIVPA